MNRIEILKTYIEISIYYEKRKLEEFGDWRPGANQEAMDILNKELENPRVVQTRYLFKDTREDVESINKIWEEKMLTEIEEKFGVWGTHFKNNKFVLDESSFGKPIVI